MADPIELKSIVNDVIEASGDKRKISSDMIKEQTNVLKKLKKSNTQPDPLCQCNQKCTERVPQRSKDELYKMFVEMDNEDVQNTFLQKIIKTIPVANRLFSKETTVNDINYDSDNDVESDFDETSSLASLDSNEENDKSLESDSTETSKMSLSSFNCVNVCQKAFLNLFGISDKRLKTVRELLIMKARKKQMKHMMEREENQIEISSAKSLAQSCFPLMALFNEEDGKMVSDHLMAAISNDINVVDNFFYNQLWKPEYLH